MTRSEIKENLMVALDTLRARKIRSALTILGIVIGVTSVISVAAIIDGLNGYIQNRIRSFGSRSFFVSRIPPGFTGIGRLPAKIRVRKYLEIDDAQFLKQNISGLDVSAAFAQRIDFAQTQPDSIRYADQHVERLIVRGTQPEYAAALPLFTVATGRYISQYDEEHARNVVVIGNAIADSLFPHTDPLGKQVHLDGRLYEVIGVFEKDPGLFGGFGVDMFACIPLSNYHKNFPQVRDVWLIFTARDDADLNTVRDQVIEAMRRRRHVAHNAENDFDVADPNFFTALWNQLTGAMALLTGAIGSIGLLVGGIGVMNIMLVSVAERTREIGIRMATGARRFDILLQFNSEALAVCVFGGMIGIGLGLGLASLFAAIGQPVLITARPVLLALACACGTGLVFGFLPARKAAGLDPAQALAVN